MEVELSLQIPNFCNMFFHLIKNGFHLPPRNVLLEFVALLGLLELLGLLGYLGYLGPLSCLGYWVAWINSINSTNPMNSRNSDRLPPVRNWGISDKSSDVGLFGPINFLGKNVNRYSLLSHLGCWVDWVKTQ